MYPIQGVVQPYSWGGNTFIRELFSLSIEQEKPAAEYWLGVHPAAPSTAGSRNLQEIIAADPKEMLGEEVAKKFSSLPYLAKVLDVKQMLSIQVHPTQAGAVEGFEEEERLAIPINAPHRNYKDRNHKPEVMVALGDFYLLHGFKPKDELLQTLLSIPELNVFVEIFSKEGYRGLYRAAMEMPAEEIDELLRPLASRILPLYHSGTLQKGDPSFWAARAMETFCSEGPLDRGILSVYFFNLLLLREGEGIYQPAGLPHAYLEGRNVEVMANSDNVLRAGLTPKHVDVPQLLKHVRFEPTEPKIIRQEGGSHDVYITGAEEFEVHRYRLSKNEKASGVTRTAELFLCLDGDGELESATKGFEFSRGKSLLLKADAPFKLRSRSDLLLFRVTVPESKN